MIFKYENDSRFGTNIKGEPCSLYCKPINENVYRQIRNTAEDGTPCSDDLLVNKICLQGECRVS